MIKNSRPLPSFFDLTDRVAVVTGGSGLLGSEFCRILAEAGAKVVIADIDIGPAKSLATSLNKEDKQAIAVDVDVVQPASVHKMIAATLDAFGRVDILVNSAALDPKFDVKSAEKFQAQAGSGAFEDYPLDAWNQALAVNLTGVFLCCQAASHAMLAKDKSAPGGVIINISSIYGLAGPDQRLYQRPGQPPQYKPVYYSVTKAGVLGLTRYLAAYYAGKNIRVNALSPGGVYNGHDEAFIQSYAARTIIGRMAEKDEMNGALLFLASDASAYMTGANLVIDGGWTTW